MRARRHAACAEMALGLPGKADRGARDEVWGRASGPAIMSADVRSIDAAGCGAAAPQRGFMMEAAQPKDDSQRPALGGLDYSNFYYSAGDDIFNVLDPFREWLR